MSIPETVAALIGLLDPPLWLVTGRHRERHGGLIATNVASASIVPEMPRLVVGLARQHHTHELVEASGALTLHLFTAGRVEWVWRFGLTSGRQQDKLAGLAWTAGASGAPVLAGALGWMACKVEDTLNTGDRTLFLVEVIAASGPLGEGPPLTLKAMLALASPQQKAELKRQLERDARIDALAIDTWRATRGSA
jgi:flavin reductase (DIM6/NTAB) family NADH-FMN oxidoreductase RutF